VKKGQKALEKNNLQEAKKLFKKAIKEFDRTYQAYAYLGIIASMEKDYKSSLNYFQESLKQFDRYKTHILERKKDYMKEFERKANSARIELDQHDQQYSGTNATESENIYYEYKNKVKALKKEIEKDKNMKYNAFFRFKYGNVLMATGNRQLAKKQYQLAVDTKPEFKDSYANLAVCYFLDGDCANAMKIYKQGKKLGTKFHPKFEQDLLKRCK
jgi:tetratricopeptide (TPR) repeat protein